MKPEALRLCWLMDRSMKAASFKHNRELLFVCFLFCLALTPFHHFPCSCTITHPSFSQDMSSSSDSLELEAGTVSQPLPNSILICAFWVDGCFCLQLGLDSQIPSDVCLLKFASMSSWNHCIINKSNIYFFIRTEHFVQWALWADMLVNVGFVFCFLLRYPLF